MKLLQFPTCWPIKGYSFTDLGAEGCCRSLNALFFLPFQDRLAAFQFLATMYIKYIQAFRRLGECYDQIVHPQKRRVLRHMLDGVMGRILELKNEMVNLEFSEFHYFDDVLSDLKLTPVWTYMYNAWNKILVRIDCQVLCMAHTYTHIVNPWDLPVTFIIIQKLSKDTLYFTLTRKIIGLVLVCQEIQNFTGVTFLPLRHTLIKCFVKP